MIRKLSCIPMTQKAAALRLGRQIGRFQNTPPDPSYWSTHAAALGVGLQEIQVKNTAERFSSLTAGDGDDYSRTRQVWQEEVRIVHPWWYNSIRRFCTIGCSRAGTDEPIITVQRFADHVHLAHPYTWILGPGAALVKGKRSHKVMVVDAGCSQCGFGNLASSSGQNPTFWRSDNRRRKFTDSFAKLQVY